MDHAAARKHMVDSQVRPHDVTNLDLQAAMEQVPRETFVPVNAQPMAYAEMDLELFAGRQLLQARDFAKLIHAARVQPDDVVLDIGCGYGYSAAILARLASMVMAVEEQAEIVAAAEKKLADLALDNVVVVQGALTEGLSKQGPFDVIVIASGAVETVPDALFEQLKDEGRLVCIKMRNGLGHATIFTKSDGHIGQREAFEATPGGIVLGFALERAFEF